MDIVLIPAYEPDKELIKLTEGLKEKGFEILVVDDGSGEKYADIFAAVKKNATVISYKKNRGKGSALKTGMRYIKEKLPECEFFITCDADGQHKIEDVVRVREKLHSGEKFVLTVRRARTKIPLRSKFGNSLSRFVYALLSNRYLSDNQSGMRGFSRVHLDWLIEVEKDNYDYEMNMLYYAAKKNIKISTLPIEAIYIGNNESSHFNPVKDTLRIYRSLFRLALGSFIALALCEISVLFISIFLGYFRVEITIPSVGALGYLTTIILNRYIFFRHTRCYDYLNQLIYTIIVYFVYMLGCMVFKYALPEMPLFFGFNLIYIFCIPLRYFLHKFIFIASIPKEV